MVNTLGTITQSHCYDQSSFDDCVELRVISILEIGHVFPLIVVDTNESIGLVTASVDGESQLSKEVTIMFLDRLLGKIYFWVTCPLL